MRLILRQAAWTALCFLLLYGVTLALSFLIAPAAPQDGRIDAWSAGGTLFLTSPKYAVLGRSTLNVPGRKVLLVGASNTGLGFRPATLQPLVPCALVSNLAIGSANISELREMIDLVHEVQNPAARSGDIFVIGVWYGMFIDTAQLWRGNDRHRGDTDVDIELYRYGFYRRGAAGPVAVLPPRWLRLGVTLIRPYLLLEKLARDSTDVLRHALFARQPELTDGDRERMVMSPAARQDALAYWRDTIGPRGAISPAQIDLLRDTIEALLQANEKVVLADLPLPAWHRDASPYQAAYASASRELFAHFANRPGFAALRMPDLDNDADYSDEVHAKPHLARVWAARLAGVLDPLACPDDGQKRPAMAPEISANTEPH